jgi:hypothetical protein
LLWASAVYLSVSVGLALWLLPTGREQAPFAFSEPRNTSPHTVTAGARATLLQRARVWHPATRDGAGMGNPPDPGGALSEAIVRCRYLPAPARGTTSKFDCVLRDGEIVKVKYGHTGEIHAEVAASRLLAALGFGADRMYMVPRVRCYGCVRTPFYTMWALDYVGMRDRFTRTIPADSFTDFEWVAVERRFDGRDIQAGGQSGWAWYELDPIDDATGANRAERDALRLAAMLLAHWDNKASNQRLVCTSAQSDGATHEDGSSCAAPFAFVHDLGATFGPNKLDLHQWQQAPVWADRATCLVSMRGFPYTGGTFRDSRISEAGRQLILRQLARLDDRQLLELFTAARFREFHRGRGDGADLNAWVRAFQAKAREIRDAGPCE